MRELNDSTIRELTEVVRAFANERDWEQFHSHRNLLLALVGEVGELAAEFQWTADDGVETALSDGEKMNAIESELADVFNYLLRLADVMNVNLESALRKKLEINSIRYPVDKSKGSSQKYTAYE